MRAVFLLPLAVIAAAGCIVPPVLRQSTAAVPVVTTPAAEPVTAVSQSADPHELPPGKTVTVIPASSGPSPTTDNPRDPREARGGRGGTIGIGGGDHGGGRHGRGGR